MTPMVARKSDKKRNLRSHKWFGDADRDGFIHRSWMKNQGLPHHLFDGRPVIGICNTFSELTPCNSHFRTLAEQVKIGVYEAGGFPLEFPVMSLGETLLRPTAMLYRNLASMDVEESIRGNPLDGVVLLAGCDKTTPATLMGAASVDLPTILVSGGPMLSGKYRGTDIGSGTNTWSMSEDLRAGRIRLEEFHEAESCMHRSHGHCMTMGTASTMASMIEALGVGMPGNAAIPAVDANGPSPTDEFIKGLWRENPVFVTVLGMCPTLAVSNSAKNALAMGLATTVVLAMSGAAIAAVRKWVPSEVRIATFILIIASFVTWLYVLRYIPLSIAFPLSRVVDILVPLGCWIFLGELISTLRWCGIALVVIGLALVAKPVAQIEERL